MKMAWVCRRRAGLGRSFFVGGSPRPSPINIESLKGSGHATQLRLDGFPLIKYGTVRVGTNDVGVEGGHTGLALGPDLGQVTFQVGHLDHVRSNPHQDHTGGSVTTGPCLHQWPCLPPVQVREGDGLLFRSAQHKWQWHWAHSAHTQPLPC